MKKSGLFTYVLLTLGVATTMSLAFISPNVSSNYLRSRASNAKSVVSISSSSLTMSNNYSVATETSGFTSGSLFSLSPEGYIKNTEPIRGITSIELVYGEGSPWAKIVPCYKDFENSGNIVTTTDTWPDASESADFSSSPIDYFEIYNQEEEDDVVITAMYITYGCSTSSYTFNVSFSPDWNSKTADNPADIYIAGSAELISDGTASSGTWKYKKLSYLNGTYSYSSPSALETGKYKYAFYTVENGGTFNWSNKSNEGDVSLILDSNINDTTSYSWSNEPGYVSPTSYSLEITINLGTNDEINYLELNYQKSSNKNMELYTGDMTKTTIGYNWDDLSASSNTFTVSNIDQDEALYFFFKMYDWGVSDNVTIGGDSSWHAIKYVPLELENNTVTISCSSYGTSKTAGGELGYTGAVVGNSSYGAVSAAIVSSSQIYHNDVTLSVYETTTISPTFSGSSEAFTASYTGENIRIDDNLTITGIKAGTSTQVTLTTIGGKSCTFTVTVPNSTYSAYYDTAASGGTSVSEGWFTSTYVEEISGMGSDFYNGIDTSSFKALIDEGAKFYNASGVEQHLFYILKDAGVNWIRLKLWVDPYTSDSVSYGGGIGDLDSTLYMAKEAKKAGLNFLLDFHYSDYWTHPGQQIIPKSWNDCNSISALQARIKSYTTDTLNEFKDNNCLPDMVQLGNEISSGIYLQKYSGGTESFDAYGQPSYLTGKSNYSYGTNNASQYTNYIKAASEGVDAVSSSIKKVLHWAKGSSISASVINSFFNNMPSSYYDYAAISFYPYYCFDTMAVAKNILNGLSLAKPWFVAETSYPFSGNGYVSGVTNFTISSWNTGDTNINSSYAFTGSGQAKLIHDLTSAVVSAGGKGIFYWESAWIPNANVGWAGSGSNNTWGNQGFFSFDGKAIANLDLFAQMSPYIA